MHMIWCILCLTLFSNTCFYSDIFIFLDRSRTMFGLRLILWINWSASDAYDLVYLIFDTFLQYLFLKWYLHLSWQVMDHVWFTFDIFKKWIWGHWYFPYSWIRFVIRKIIIAFCAIQTRCSLLISSIRTRYFPLISSLWRNVLSKFLLASIIKRITPVNCKFLI